MRKLTLTLNNLELDVFCGCNEVEKVTPASVFVTIDICFEELNACHTDLIDDTICYDALTKKIRETTKNKHYNLIEHLAATIFDIIKKNVNNKGLIATVSVLVEKKTMQILGIDSAQFRITDDL